ncbi:MAG TPA: type II secretion system protein [Pirellulales bacterium]|jgi:prepilin-type N-terminal cleavage/methylation domain-containing protein
MNRSARPSGVTLLELIIVLAIIAGLLALLFPAISHVRASARRTVCANNLNQLRVALAHYSESRKKLPDAPVANRASGWAIAILPYLEETQLGLQFANAPRVSLVAGPAMHRPNVMTCPDGWEGDSEIAGIPASHYAFWTSDRHDIFLVYDVPTTSRNSWVESPERIAMPAGKGPHSGGYFESGSNGDAKLVDGN